MKPLEFYKFEYTCHDAGNNNEFQRVKGVITANSLSHAEDVLAYHLSITDRHLISKEIEILSLVDKIRVFSVERN